MKVTCLMITTTVKERLHLLHNTIMSIEKCNKTKVLDQKVLSVDIIEGHPYEAQHFQQYRDLGWFVVEGSCLGRQGMANNMLRGLANVDHDLLFYCEDDVVIHRIPTKKHLKELFDSKLGNVGAIVYNTHACAPWEETGLESKLKYINDKCNYFGDGEDWFLAKGDPIKDEYWITFPAAIMKTINFRNCLNYACVHCVNKGMEPGMTQAWFDLGLGDSTVVVMYVKKEINKHFPLDFQGLYNMANMQFWNNDVNLRHASVNNRQNTIF